MRPVQILILLLLLVGGLGYFLFGGDGAPVDGLERESPNSDHVSHSETGSETGREDSASVVGDNDRTSIDSTVPETVVEASRDFSTVDANRLVGLIVNSEGEPVADCEVIFVANGSGAFTWNPMGELELGEQPTVTTGEDGTFAFDVLPPGENHALIVRHPVILNTIIEGVIVGDFGEFVEPPIVLRFGKRVRGVVKNEFGLPIPGARLHLDARWIPTGPRASADRVSATTDDEGKYLISGIADGTRCLTVEAEGFGTLTRIQSLIFADKTGQIHVVNFTLKSQTKMTGRVTSLEGRGIEGAEVVAVDRAAYRDVGNSRAVTGPDGRYSVEKLPPGKYEVRVHARGYESTVLQDVQTPIEDLNWMLLPALRVRGQVVDASNGSAISDFSLRFRQVQAVDGATVPRGGFEAFAGAPDGEFEIPALQALGNWCLEARAEGFAASYSQPFDTAVMGEVSDIVISMDRGGAIRGRLVDTAGQPLFGGRVTSRDDGWVDDAFSAALGAQGEGNGTVSDARSGTDGVFRLTNLRSGTYQLAARTANLHQVQVRGLTVVEGEETDVGDVVLQEGAGLRGQLLDAEGSEVSGGMVFLQPTDQAGQAPVRRVKSGAEGDWRFANVVPGAYLLSASPPSQRRGSFSLWPERGGEEIALRGGVEDVRDVHLDDWTKPKPPPPLPPSGNVGGTLLGPDGVGVVGAGVELVAVDPPSLSPLMSKSEREGKFNFLRVPPGQYVLFASGHDEPRIPVTVVADEWTHHDLELTQ